MSRKRLTTEEFIKKAKKVHGDRYDYSLVVYNGYKTKIKIICREHGVFEQNPGDHYSNGCGCPKCYLIKKNRNINNQKIGLDKFIIRSNEIHNNKYDYSLVQYKNCKTKVKIICPEHGVFKQIPDHHYRGVGCPKCYDFTNKYLYIIFDNELGLYKIGFSNNPDRRIKDITKGKNKNTLKIITKYENCGHLEKILHKKYDNFRENHTFYEDGNSEWFRLTHKQLEEIDNDVKSQI
jgi:hypothetical protein